MLRIPVEWWAVVFGLACGSPAGHGNVLSNGDFGLELVSWEVAGSVFAAAGAAVVTDEGVARSLVYQGAALAPGAYRVEFDFHNLLALAEPVGFARDSFYASLYFSEAAGLFDPAAPTGFTGFLPLLDLDRVTLEPYSGLVSASPAGGQFQRYSAPFSLAAAVTVFVVFDLVDLNGIDDDSAVLVDTVVLAVPEPLAMLPLGIAAGLLVALKRRRR